MPANQNIVDNLVSGLFLMLERLTRIAFLQRVVWFADELRKREVRDAESGS